jgi:hypothetical protein
MGKQMISFCKKISLAILLLSSLICFSNKIDASSSKIANTIGESATTEQKQNTFSVLACITWWSHDAVGYHPAMSLFLENTSGHSITGGEIPFQGRFTDVRTGDVTVSREYRRAPIRDHERLSVLFRGPKYYELPIDSSLWPTIECKAMCRLNNTNVEDLFMVHLAQITMTDEDAQAQLVAQAGRSPLLAKNKDGKSVALDFSEVDTVHSKNGESLPLHASPGTITSTAPNNSESTKTVNGVKKISNNSMPKNLPCIGSDFYAFDKLYGDAIDVKSGTVGNDLTWTHYKVDSLVKDIFVGSRNANKADVIIAVLGSAVKEKELASLAKLIANSKGDTIAPFAHSVKYLPAGRSEIMTTAIRENRIMAFEVDRGSSTGSVIVVSRLPGDLEMALSNYCRRVSFLRFLEL